MALCTPLAPNLAERTVLDPPCYDGEISMLPYLQNISPASPKLFPGPSRRYYSPRNAVFPQYLDDHFKPSIVLSLDEARELWIIRYCVRLQPGKYPLRGLPSLCSSKGVSFFLIRPILLSLGNLFTLSQNEDIRVYLQLLSHCLHLQKCGARRGDFGSSQKADELNDEKHASLVGLRPCFRRSKEAVKKENIEENLGI